MRRFYSEFHSPIGKMILQANDSALLGVWFDVKRPQKVLTNSEHPILIETERQLQEYFLGTRKTFDLPLSVKGTSFQCQVWEVLKQIPYGETWSYQQVARAI